MSAKGWDKLVTHTLIVAMLYSTGTGRFLN